MGEFNSGKPSKQNKGLRWISIIAIGMILILLPLWFYFYYPLELVFGYKVGYYASLTRINEECNNERVFPAITCQEYERLTLLIFGLAIAGGVITLKGLAGLKGESNKFDKI